MVAPYTLAEARQLLAQYKAAEIALIDGQASHYRIGTREFTSLDLRWIQQRIRELAGWIAALEGSVRTKRAVFVVPRDM